MVQIVKNEYQTNIKYPLIIPINCNETSIILNLFFGLFQQFFQKYQYHYCTLE